jgi:FMN phosphatase YigB (HAD superfamily)
MIHFIFDLDDTLIMHNNKPIHYDRIQEDFPLTKLLGTCNNKGSCYIYTNGTGSHALSILKNMKIMDIFDKIYSRDTMPYMKPYYKSFDDVHTDLSFRDPQPKVIFFFDDQLENLKTASQVGWVTFWIHPHHVKARDYHYVNMAFPTINDCLTYLETKI